MCNQSGISGQMVVRTGSKLTPNSTRLRLCNILVPTYINVCSYIRSALQVTERLDRLISEIIEIQRPAFCVDYRSQTPADVVLVKRLVSS